jgi:hypothetical protein
MVVRDNEPGSEAVEVSNLPYPYLSYNKLLVKPTALKIKNGQTKKQNP